MNITVRTQGGDQLFLELDEDATVEYSISTPTLKISSLFIINLYSI